MKITERRLRSIIQSIILENKKNNLSLAEIKKEFEEMDFDDLADACDLPANDFTSSSSYYKKIKAHDTVLCKGAIPKDEEHYNAKNEEDYYLVLGFTEEEFEDKSAGSSYTRSSVYKRDNKKFNVVYLASLTEEIYYFVLDENNIINSIEKV